jgi:hypothetical protein
MKVVYLTMQFESDLSNAGAPDSPNFLKHKALGVGEPVAAVGCANPSGSSERS